MRCFSPTELAHIAHLVATAGGSGWTSPGVLVALATLAVMVIIAVDQRRTAARQERRAEERDQALDALQNRVAGLEREVAGVQGGVRASSRPRARRRAPHPHLTDHGHVAAGVVTPPYTPYCKVCKGWWI
jgi:heme exporter protein D